VAATSPTLDHVVIDVRDRMDEAARLYQALGFTLTPRGYHTLGSMNHLMMFGSDYLELLGFGEGRMRPELAPFPIGLNGLVFKTDDADATFAQAQSQGLPILPVQAFSRPVALESGTQDAKFRTTRLDPTKIAMGRVYFCEHLTPELVWRPEWQSHANGAQSIRRVVVASPDPQATARLFGSLFGSEAVTEKAGGRTVTASSMRVEIVTPDAVAAEFGDGAPEASGRLEYLAAVEFGVAKLADTAQRLGAIPHVRVEANHVMIPARGAFNTTLVLSA
jgi:catechol 2,3-dioxygenase-like lactoylglutathione lyase family enzyme